MKRAAMRCVFSMLSMSFFRYGPQTTAPYSKRGGQGRCKPAVCRQVGSAGDFCVESPRWSWPSSLCQWCGSPTSGRKTGEFQGRGCFGRAWGWSYSAGSRSWFWSLRWVCSTCAGLVSCPSRLTISLAVADRVGGCGGLWRCLSPDIGGNHQERAKHWIWHCCGDRWCVEGRGGARVLTPGALRKRPRLSQRRSPQAQLSSFNRWGTKSANGAEVQQCRSVTACEGAYFADPSARIVSASMPTESLCLI